MFKSKISQWWDNREGVAAIEAAMIFPILAVMLVGVYDMGNPYGRPQSTFPIAVMWLP